MTDTTLLSRRIRDYVEALIAAGEEGDRLPTMGELRRRFGGASNGAVQQALEPLKASGSIITTRGPYGGGAASYAIVVKLTRSLMIIPIVVTLAAMRGRRERAAGGKVPGRMPWRRMIPAFLVGFVIAAALDTVGAVPPAWHPGLSALGTFLITVALAGIGLNLRFSEMRKSGHRPLLLDGMLWGAVGLTSLGLQALTGTL